ncbi:MAG: hypothetical protein M0Z76_09950 [Gammaproteobacteria bacterium]|nr:hypothetical protein [Gammaproteobacteria bacterium]
MMDLGSSWRSAAEWVDGLPLRERALLFALALAIVYGGVYGLLIRPLQRHERAIGVALQVVQKQTQAADRQMRHFANPRAHARALAQLQALQQKVQTLQQRLAHLASGLVPPRDMTRLVQHVLRHSPGVMIMRLHNVPPIAIAPHEKGAPVLYRHGLIVEVRGRYGPLVDYLQRLARQKQRVLWGPFDLTADHYPFSTIRLELYTLSLQRAWLR